MRMRTEGCGCPIDDNYRVVSLCGTHHGDESCYPQPNGSVAYTPKNAVELNAAVCKATYDARLAAWSNEHSLDAA